MAPTVLLTFTCLLVHIFSSGHTKGMSIVSFWERHSRVGVETCKRRCVQTGSCRAVLYSPASIFCFLTLKQAPASPPRGFILFARETLKVKGKQCAEPCREGVCLRSHSKKNVCGIKHCVHFLHPPIVPFSSATVQLTDNEAIAEYRCHTNYSFFRRNPTQQVLCAGDCTWEDPSFKCINTRVDDSLLSLDAPIPLPVHFGRGKTVRICGIPRQKKSFTINFERKKDILLHINPRFKLRTIYGWDKRTTCFATSENGKFSHETKVKVFFFTPSAPFCLSLRRIPGHYQLLDGNGKVRHTIKDYFKRRKAYNVSIHGVDVTSVEMRMNGAT